MLVQDLGHEEALAEYMQNEEILKLRVVQMKKACTLITSCICGLAGLNVLHSRFTHAPPAGGERPG